MITELNIWKKKKIIGSTQVDEDVYEKYKWVKWRIANGYVVGTISYRNQVKLHRHIMNAPKNMEVDHKDGNPLNNLRSNLRICTRLQNARNRKKSIHGKVPYKGVRHNIADSRNRGYTARISIGGKYIDLGTYATSLEAARAYDTAARHHYGEYARLNFPNECVEVLSKKTIIKTSQYRGVQLRSPGVWRAVLSKNGKNINLGKFDSEEVAAHAYDEAVIKNYGTGNPRMKLNFPCATIET